MVVKSREARAIPAGKLAPPPPTSSNSHRRNETPTAPATTSAAPRPPRRWEYLYRSMICFGGWFVLAWLGMLFVRFQKR